MLEKLKKLESEGGKSFRESMDEIIKAFHINWQVKGHSKVLRNATKWLITECTDETKAEISTIMSKMLDAEQRDKGVLPRAKRTPAPQAAAKAM
jgi:hypothetical protein